MEIFFWSRYGLCFRQQHQSYFSYLCDLKKDLGDGRKFGTTLMKKTVGRIGIINSDLNSDQFFSVWTTSKWHQVGSVCWISKFILCALGLKSMEPPIEERFAWSFNVPGFHHLTFHTLDLSRPDLLFSSLSCLDLLQSDVLWVDPSFCPLLLSFSEHTIPSYTHPRSCHPHPINQ
jgi:hypothetical protein